MICALLIFQRTTFERSLDLMSPWLEMQTRDIGAVIADLEAQQHRRFIKSHTPLDGLPYEEAVTYICVGRDPRDVAISWAHYPDNINLEALFTARDRAVGNEDLAEMYPRLGTCADRSARTLLALGGRTERPANWTHVNLASTMHHLATFWEVREQPNVVLVHYADLQRDLEGEMRRIAQRLDIDIDEDRLADLVAAAGFDTMRERADETRARLQPGHAAEQSSVLPQRPHRPMARTARRRRAASIRRASQAARTDRPHRVGTPRTRRQPLARERAAWHVR